MIQEEQLPKILPPGIALAFAMYVFCMLSIAFSQIFQHSAILVSVVVLVASGILLRLKLWTGPGEALAILCMALSLWLVFFISDVEFFAVHFLPFYWLPFTIGLLFGGIRIRRRTQPA